jgi:hypothetical protein
MNIMLYCTIYQFKWSYLQAMPMASAILAAKACLHVGSRPTRLDLDDLRRLGHPHQPGQAGKIVLGKSNPSRTYKKSIFKGKWLN